MRCQAGASSCDFCLIGEAVAPGFDFHDFTWITPAMVAGAAGCAAAVAEAVTPYVHVDAQALSHGNATTEDAAAHYEQGQQRDQRTNDRL